MIAYSVTIDTGKGPQTYRTFADTKAEAKSKVCTFMQTEPNTIHSVKKLKNQTTMKTFIYKLFIRTGSQEFTVGMYKLQAQDIDAANKQFNRFDLPFHHHSTVQIEK